MKKSEFEPTSNVDIVIFYLSILIFKNFIMITWIQLVLQKHHKFVFSVLLVAIVIAFVFTIGSVPFFGDSQGGGAKQNKEFYGFDFSNEAVVNNLQNAVYYEIILSGQQPQSQEQFTQLMLRQAYARFLADKLGILQVSQAELTEYIQSSPLFAGKDGKFDAESFKKFVAARLASTRMSEEYLSSILAQNALVAKVVKLLGGPGYMPKFEVEREYAQMYGKWDFNMAVLSMDKFKPEIKPTQEVLQKYFKDNIEAYRIGEGVVLETVFIPSADFAKQVVPTDAEMASYFAANSSKYATTKDGKPYSPKLEEVKSKVKADMVEANSLVKATHVAEELVLKVYEAEAKKGSAEFKKIIADAKVVLKKSSPIRVTDSALPKDIPTQVAVEGLKLDDNRFYTDPIPAGDGVWVAFLSEKLASYLPKYDDVKAKVLENYVSAEKSRLFNERANALGKTLEKAVAEKKSFVTVARDGGAKVEKIKDFSLSDPKGEAVLQAYSAISSTLPTLKVGAVSAVKTFGGNAYVFELVKFTPPNDKADAEKIKNLTKRMTDVSSMITSMSVISEKVQAQEKSLQSE